MFSRVSPACQPAFAAASRGTLLTPLLNFAAASGAAWMENSANSSDEMEIDRVGFQQELVRDLRQQHLALLDEQGVIDELQEAGRIDDVDITDPEDARRLLRFLYGSEPFDDLQTGIVTNAFDSGPAANW